MVKRVNSTSASTASPAALSSTNKKAKPIETLGPDAVKACVEAFKNGKPVMVFDSAFREMETDLLFPATGKKTITNKQA